MARSFITIYGIPPVIFSARLSSLSSALLAFFLIFVHSVPRVPSANAELTFSPCASFTHEERIRLRNLTVNMFEHGFHNYLHSAFPNDELRPISGTGFSEFGGVAMTLIDSLDTLAVMGMTEKFLSAVAVVSTALDSFHVDKTVSVFETTIRVLGGLLSAHLFMTEQAKDSGVDRYVRQHQSPTHSSTKGQDVDAPKNIPSRPTRITFDLDLADLLQDIIINDIVLPDGMQASSATTPSATTTTTSSSGSRHERIRNRHPKGMSQATPHAHHLNTRILNYYISMSSSTQTNSAFETDNEINSSNDNLGGNSPEHEKKQSRNQTAGENRNSQDHVFNSHKSQAHPIPTPTNAKSPHPFIYDGQLLRLAIDLGNRLLPAFNTPTGIPYGSIHLIHGVSPRESKIASVAGAGSLLLEFGTLTRLTDNHTYYDVAYKALTAVYERRTWTGLVGNHINIFTGTWTAIESGIGALIDSYYEYMLKGYILFHDERLLTMFTDGYKAIKRHIRKGVWNLQVDMNSGQITSYIQSSLAAFFPGLQVLAGDLDDAIITNRAHYSVWKKYGCLPEGYDVDAKQPVVTQINYPLRPELIESTFYIHWATNDTSWLGVARNIIESIHSVAKVNYGYARIKNTVHLELEDAMDSFFLSETTKYLYLIFESDHWIRRGGYIFTTEGHPLPVVPMFNSSSQRQYHEREYMELLKNKLQNFNHAGKAGKSGPSSSSSSSSKQESCINDVGRGDQESAAKKCSGGSAKKNNIKIPSSEHFVKSILKPRKCRRPDLALERGQCGFGMPGTDRPSFDRNLHASGKVIPNDVQQQLRNLMQQMPAKETKPNTSSQEMKPTRMTETPPPTPTASSENRGKSDESQEKVGENDNKSVDEKVLRDGDICSISTNEKGETICVDRNNENSEEETANTDPEKTTPSVGDINHEESKAEDKNSEASTAEETKTENIDESEDPKNETDDNNSTAQNEDGGGGNNIDNESPNEQTALPPIKIGDHFYSASEKSWYRVVKFFKYSGDSYSVHLAAVDQKEPSVPWETSSILMLDDVENGSEELEEY